MATFKFLDINGVSTLLNQLKNTFVKKTDVENSFSDVSTNPVQNKVIKAALDDKVDKVEGKQLSTEDFTTELKTKLDGIDPGATKITVDEELSSTSTNPVQNKVINAALGEKVPTANVTSTISSTDGSKIPTSQAVIDYVEENGGGGGGGSYTDNTILVPVTANGFTLSETTGRYEQTITVEGMTSGLSGTWDILRSGEVLSDTESHIALCITDVIRQTDAIKIVSMEIPKQDYTLVLSGTFKSTT